MRHALSTAVALSVVLTVSSLSLNHYGSSTCNGPVLTSFFLPPNTCVVENGRTHTYREVGSGETCSAYVEVREGEDCGAQGGETSRVNLEMGECVKTGAYSLRATCESRTSDFIPGKYIMAFGYSDDKCANKQGQAFVALEQCIEGTFLQCKDGKLYSRGCGSGSNALVAMQGCTNLQPFGTVSFDPAGCLWSLPSGSGGSASDQSGQIDARPAGGCRGPASSFVKSSDPDWMTWCPFTSNGICNGHGTCEKPLDLTETCVPSIPPHPRCKCDAAYNVGGNCLSEATVNRELTADIALTQAEILVSHQFTQRWNFCTNPEKQVYCGPKSANPLVQNPRECQSAIQGCYSATEIPSVNDAINNNASSVCASIGTNQRFCPALGCLDEHAECPALPPCTPPLGTRCPDGSCQTEQSKCTSKSPCTAGIVCPDGITCANALGDCAKKMAWDGCMAGYEPCPQDARQCGPAGDEAYCARVTGCPKDKKLCGWKRGPAGDIMLENGERVRDCLDSCPAVAIAVMNSKPRPTLIVPQPGLLVTASVPDMRSSSSKPLLTLTVPTTVRNLVGPRKYNLQINPVADSVRDFGSFGNVREALAAPLVTITAGAPIDPSDDGLEMCFSVGDASALKDDVSCAATLRQLNVYKVSDISDPTEIPQFAGICQRPFAFNYQGYSSCTCCAKIRSCCSTFGVADASILKSAVVVEGAGLPASTPSSLAPRCLPPTLWLAAVLAMLFVAL